MVENKKPEDKKECPINEWVRHALYVGGMVAMHTGLCATASVASKSENCPVGEWGRHAVYVGGFLALATQTHLMITDGNKKGEDSKNCPVTNELYRHAAYIAGMVGVVALINSRKK